MSPPRLALALALVAGAAPPLLAQPLPAPLSPDTFTAADAPNDAGGGIAVIWPAAPGERRADGDAPAAPTTTYEYVVSIAAEGDFVELERVPATAGWQRDIASKFGTGALFSNDHAVILDPVLAFPAGDVAAAALGDEAAAGRVRAALGAGAIDEAKVILDRLKIATSADLKAYPPALEEITHDVVYDRGFKVRLVARDPAAPERAAVVAEASGVRPRPNWFNRALLNNLAVALLVGGAVLFFIQRARRNPDLYLRRIGGLDAIDEALGRATEMGKPVLFVHGLETLQKVPTIAAVNILGEVAKKVAAFDTRLICTNYDPIVLTVSQETVREGFLRAGRPDAYNPDDVFVAGAEQFSYVAAVDGIMIRQRPAANIYAGYFYAESLLLAETGASTGAIQIAATDAYTQLPFFVTTCDYTLMGEELYAASAYLSRDPPLLGSLRGQDVGKAAIILYLLAGAALAAANVDTLLLLVKT